MHHTSAPLFSNRDVLQVVIGITLLDCRCLLHGEDTVAVGDTSAVLLMELWSRIIQILAQINFWKRIDNIRVWNSVLVLEVKTIVYIVLSFHMNRTWTITVVSYLWLLEEVLVSYTEAIIEHPRLCMIACMGWFTYLLFINIHIFLSSILLFCILMLIPTVWKRLHADGFHHTFHCGPRARNLI